MLRRIFFALLILSICSNLTFPQKKDPAMKPTFHLKGNGVGYILLNGVIVTFEGLNPQKPDEWRKKVHISLNRLNKEASLARTKQNIDEPFFYPIPSHIACTEAGYAKGKRKRRYRQTWR